MIDDPLMVPVLRACSALVEAGLPYGGLMPSQLDRRTGRMLPASPPAIDGQREGDRAPQGCNLMLDLPTLGTLYGLAECAGMADYATAADAYLTTFLARCTATETGLFPWGEHAYWDLEREATGNSYASAKKVGALPLTHDHLRQAPGWFWDRVYALAPAAGLRFASGLHGHWQEGGMGQTVEFMRHARIDEAQGYGWGNRSCDFPRHSGFYIYDLAHAVLHGEDPAHLADLQAFLDYWWTKRDAAGLLAIESRSPADTKFAHTNAPGQTLSLAASLLEAAEVLETAKPRLALSMRMRAGRYVDGFLSAPHDLKAGRFCILSPAAGAPAGSGTLELMPIWGSKYGLWPASYIALTALCVYRFTEDERLLSWAEAVGRGVLATPFPTGPTHIAVPAMDAGLAIGLLADLYDVTGDRLWLDDGAALADTLVATYLDEPLPRAASGVDYYESQTGPGYLLHGLARFALLRSGCDDFPPDFTAR